MSLPTLAPQNMQEAMEFSKMLASSGLVPQQYRNKPQDVLVAVQWGYEVGLPPLQALQNIAVINGKPSVYGDAALALVKNDSRCAGVSETIKGEGDQRVAHCLVKRKYGNDIEETERTFSVDDAKRAGLWGRKGPWTQYADRMLMMRARGFALRDAFPDALKGVITAEEAQDYPSDNKAAQKPPKVVNPLDQLDKPAPALESKEAPKEVTDDYGDTVVVEAEPESEAKPNHLAMVKEAIKSGPQPYKLFHWNGEEAGEFKTVTDWMNGFKNLMVRMSQSKKLPHDKKVTAMADVRLKNEQVLSGLDQGDQERMKDYYLSLIEHME